MGIKSHSFIVRIWNEAEEDGKPAWRGSIEKVGNNEKLYFSRLDNMARFIQEQIEFKLPCKINIRDSLLRRIKDAINKH